MKGPVKWYYRWNWSYHLRRKWVSAHFRLAELIIIGLLAGILTVSILSLAGV